MKIENRKRIKIESVDHENVNNQVWIVEDGQTGDEDKILRCVKEPDFVVDKRWKDDGISIEGSVVHMYSWEGKSNQRWIIHKIPSSLWVCIQTAIQKDPFRVLGVDSEGWLRLQDSDGSDRQKWLLFHAPHIPDGQYYMINAASIDKVLTVIDQTSIGMRD